MSSAIKNYLHKTSFRLDIPNRNGIKSFPLVVQESMLPGMTASSVKLPLNPMLQGNIPGTAVSFDALQVRMILDEELEGYTDIFQWMTSEVDYIGGNRCLTPEELPKEILIHVIDNSKKKIVCTFKYIEPFPVTMGSVDFSYAEDGNMAMAMDVQFMYKWFEIERNGQQVHKFAPQKSTGVSLHPSMR